MSGTEATPLIRGRAIGSSPRAPSEKGQEGGERGQGSLQSSQAQTHQPRSWTSNRLFWTLPGFGLAVAAGFISATQTIEFLRQPSLQQQQQQPQQGAAAAAGEGVVSSVGDLAARTVQESSGPSAQLDIFSGAEGLVSNAQQEQLRVQGRISSPTTDADSTAATEVNRPDSLDSSRHGLESEGLAADGVVDAGVGGRGADGSEAMRSDGQGTRSGGGWRSNGISKNSGQYHELHYEQE